MKLGLQALRALAVLALLALLFTACATDDDAAEDTEPDPDTEEPDEEEPEPEEEPDEEPEADEAEEAGEPETSSIVVATIPIMAMAPFYHALDNGLFEEEGLDVTFEVGSGGAALMPRVFAGEIDIFFSAYEPFLVGRSEGFEIDLIAGAHSYDVVGDGANGMLALPDSGVETMADLGGTTIAINTFNTIGELLVTRGVEHQGIDMDTVTLVEIDFPAMPPALERGEVDAVWTAEPFVTLIKQTLDGHMLVDPNADVDIMADDELFRDVPGGAWASTSEFIEENPNTIAAFARAIHRANEEVQADPELGAEVLVANTEINPDTLAEADWPTWEVPQGQLDRLQVRADMMYESEMIPEEMDVTPFVHETAP